jgi:hypothetical protein
MTLRACDARSAQTVSQGAGWASMTLRACDGTTHPTSCMAILESTIQKRADRAVVYRRFVYCVRSRSRPSWHLQAAPNI